WRGRPSLLRSQSLADTTANLRLMLATVCDCGPRRVLCGFRFHVSAAKSNTTSDRRFQWPRASGPPIPAHPKGERQSARTTTTVQCCFQEEWRTLERLDRERLPPLAA